MKDDWTDKAFAERWDATNLQGNATRPEQLDIVVSIIADNYQPGDFVLDLGCGSGQVDQMILERCPDAHIVGVDSSAAMLALAKERLSKYRDRFRMIERDVNALSAADLPPGTYSVVFSSQVLHELDNARRLAVMEQVYDLLPFGGLFVIADRLRVDLDGVRAYRSVFNRLESAAPEKSGLSYEKYRQRVDTKEDDPASLDEMVGLLRKVGFTAAVLQLHFDRAIFAGVKAGTAAAPSAS
jgi:SAM-dependent methyltransferase